MDIAHELENRLSQIPIFRKLSLEVGTLAEGIASSGNFQCNVERFAGVLSTRGQVDTPTRRPVSVDQVA